MLLGYFSHKRTKLQMDKPSEKYVSEEELNAKAVAPRVTLESLEANIEQDFYLQPNLTPGTLTICMLILKNGFVVTGTSAAASPENFDPEIGKRVARGDAIRQVWGLMGYELRSKLDRLKSLTNKDAALGEALTRVTAATLGDPSTLRTMDADLLLEHFEGRDFGEEGGKTAAFSQISDYKLAEMCHAVNKAWCEKNGDFSQPEWLDAPQWQKDSAVNGVQFHRADPNTTPEHSHANWLSQKVKDGWVYGDVKDPEAKTHPCIVPYQLLPDVQQFKDKLFTVLIHSADSLS
jgi:hypothetical protein